MHSFYLISCKHVFVLEFIFGSFGNMNEDLRVLLYNYKKRILIIGNIF